MLRLRADQRDLFENKPLSPQGFFKEIYQTSHIIGIEFGNTVIRFGTPPSTGDITVAFKALRVT